MATSSVPLTASPRADDRLIALNRSVVRKLASYNAEVLREFGKLSRTARTDATATQSLVDRLVKKYGIWFAANEDVARRTIEAVSIAAQAGNMLRFNANIEKKLNSMGRSELVKSFAIEREEGIPKLISRQWKTQQLALIRKDGSPGAFDTPSIPKEHFERLEAIVQDAVHSGLRREELQAKLAQLDGVSARRAEVIARDQVGKYNSKMNESRTKHLGITHYFWRSVGDESVRPEHKARNGKRFAYADPPSDGPPGQPIQCRCYADPDLDAAIAARSKKR
jgi:SPP1 gp7 family putative phage head morphogenesis protein